MTQQVKKPLSILQKSINKKVSVKLKNNVEYVGRMSNIDTYMNVILEEAEEYNDGSLSANFGRVVIRGNNILFIRIHDAV